MERKRKPKRQAAKWLNMWIVVIFAWSVAVPAARPVSATGAGNIQKISVGQYYSMALTQNGKVLAWGNDWYEQTNVPIGLSDVQDIAAGYTHGAALTAGGGIVTWGAKGISSASNLNVPANLTDVKAIDAGDSFTLALKNNGTVAAWSIINDPINANLRDPYQIETPPGDAVGITMISAGKGHALALRSDGRVVAWGSTSEGASNNQGQSIVPNEAKSGIIAIAAGGYHSLALTNGGEVIAWGAGSYNNGLNHDFGQTIVPPAAKSGVIAIAAGRYHSLALKTDGTVIAWGGNGFGQSTVPQGLNGVAAIAAGDDTSLVLKQDGAVEGWGYNGYGGAVINGDLSGLMVQEGTLNPAFSPSQLSYEVAYVGASTTGVHVMATLVDAKNGVLYIDNKPQTSGSFAAVNLTGLKTVIPVTVEHPIYPPKYYEIAVFRDNTFPTVQFSPDGSGVSVLKSVSTTVTVDDTISGVDPATFEYVWTQSDSDPASGWETFTPGGSSLLFAQLEKVGGDGTWYLHVRGKDKAGNETNAVSQPFLLDNTPPVIDITMKKANDDAPYSENDWTNQNVIVSAEVTDTHPTSVSYSINDGGSWSLYSEPFRLEQDGVYPVKIEAIDAAGNKTIVSRTVKISKSAVKLTPTLTKAGGGDYTSGDWTDGSVTVSVNAEAGVSGIEKLLYAVDGGAEKPYTNKTPVEVAAEGMHTLSFKVSDNAGSSLSAFLEVNIDKTAPSVNFGVNGSETWAQSAQTTAVVGDSGGSGIVASSLQHAWTMDPVAAPAPADWTTFTNGAALEKFGADGDWFLHIRGQDAAGNPVSPTTAVSGRFRLDNTGPAVSVTMTTADNALYTGDDWTNQNVNVAVSAVDAGSGVAAVTYSLDGMTWSVYSDSIVLHEEGIHSVSIKAVDSVGNETTVQGMAKISKSGLRLTPTLTKADNSTYVSGDWTNGSVTVSTYAEAGVSGIADLTYTLDGDAEQAYTNETPILFDQPGMHTILFKVTDAAGNSFSAALEVNIDQTAPSVSFDVNGSETWAQSVQTTVAVSDSGGSGIAVSTLRYAWTMDPTAEASTLVWTPFTSGETLTKAGADGDWYLHIKGQDEAGNPVAVVSARFRLDNTAPVITLAGPSSIRMTEGETYTEAGVTATDIGGSGVADAVTVNGSVYANTPGTYTLRYNISDLAGNAAAEVTRTVTVETKPSPQTGGSTPVVAKPVIDLNGAPFDPASIDTSQPSVILDVVPKNGTAFVSIPASVLTSFEGKNATFIIEIRTSYGSYRIPVNFASLIPGLKELLAKNNLKAKDISFKITLTDKSGDKAMQAAFAKGLPNGNVLGAMVDYHIEIINIKTGQPIGTANPFSKALTRVIPLPRHVDVMPAQWGAFRYDETAKKWAFVPAKSVQIGGVWYATISSSSNSVYAVAENPTSFGDVQKHWARSFVDLAAAKGLVEGIGSGLYAPDKAVTRAEFAALLVRALGRGISAVNTGETYRDVTPDAWYFKVVMAAKELGLLDFAPGNDFKPNQPLTREEMAGMLAAAIRLEQPSAAGEAASLDGYKDIGSVDASYLEDVRLMVKLQIMKGTGEDTFSPKGLTTRAQAAVVFIRALQELGMID